MCSAAAAAIGLQVAGGAMTADAQMKQARSQQRYYAFLAHQDELQAKDLIKSGEQQVGFVQDAAAMESKSLRGQQRQFSGSQKAALAANGVPLSSVSAEDLVRDTFKREEMDAEAIRYNADVKSWEATTQALSGAKSLRSQAAGYRMGGANALEAGKLGAATTLLGTATSVADQWYHYGQTSRGKASKVK